MELKRLWSILLLAVPGCCFSQQNLVAGPYEKVAGHSQAEWTVAWWQWAASFASEDSPVADQSGARCQAGQTGEVWFLAGTYGTRRTIRSCTVPRDHYLFFPMINYVVSAGGSGASCDRYTVRAKLLTDEVHYLVAELDGERIKGLTAYRQASEECFDLGKLSGGKFRIYPSAANGYYLMLRPLAPGTHQLNFGGALPGMTQAVSYTLIVR